MKDEESHSSPVGLILYGLLVVCLLPPFLLQIMVYYVGFIPPKQDKINMTVALVVCDKVLEQGLGLALIKSMIAFAHNANLDFRIFYDNKTYAQLMRELPVLQIEARMFWDVTLDYRLYHYSFPQQEDDVFWYQFFRPCSSQRLFIADILTDVDAILYVDADIIFMSDVTDIWTYFPRMNSTHIMAMAQHDQAPNPGYYSWKPEDNFPYYGDRGLQAGVILMNLTRMRQVNFSKDIVPVTGKYLHKMTLGDQDVLNTYFAAYPERVHLVSCRFNFFRDHCQSEYERSPCQQAERQGISILHGAGREFVMTAGMEPFRNLFLIFSEMNLSSTTIQSVQQKIHAEYRRRFHWRERHCTFVPKIAWSRIDNYVTWNRLDSQ